ncbi:MAG: sensor histidine kinase [Verrucomicrobia bacterium]|nr:MAG: sensor histidine kinase [Verrucomicrobiota bacterium]TAE87788.1 MAG: sensor histidine kinase [Verrucomicrobiota bacterium]TAF25531.1 MAG: sensor histidine kinase [Verrucomicrobiota bacterium]TAF41402.1 MAG: sensor histidine kinase [Verrucomicrobiota bacterium]
MIVSISRFRGIALSLLWVGFAVGDLRAESGTIEGIRAMSPERAGQGLPVSLRATVTFSNPRFATLFVHDGRAGLFVEQDADLKGVRLVAGDLIEIEGVTGAGLFAPVIRAREIRVLGSGPLPASLRVSGEELSRPDQDSNWVTVEADVREVTQAGSDILLECQAGPCNFTTLIQSGGAQEVVPWDLADRRVRIEGVAATIFNTGRQMTRRLVRVNDVSDVVPLDTNSEGSGPPRMVTIDRLFRVDGPGPGELVRLSGIVHLALPGRGFYLRTEVGSIWVQTAQPIAAVPGSLIEVEGWPRAGKMKPFIRARRATIVGGGVASDPLALAARDALNSRYDSELLAVEADLLDVIRTPEGLTLELRDTNLVFRASLTGSFPHLPDDLRPGSRIRVTGIAEISSSAQVQQPLREDSRLLLRSRSLDDLEVLSRPPWWNLQRAAWAVGSGLVLLLLIYGLAQIRRRREQETQRREFEAVLAERGRFAREIHDSLAQGLTSISLQLECLRDDIAVDPVRALSHVETARALVRESLGEARRTVWNLRPLALGEADLATALQRQAAVLTRDGRVICSQEIEGVPRPLPAEHESALLRIGQEALTNAVRHAGASRIIVRLRFGAGWVTLTVRDDGRGFDVVERVGKGYGLTGMHERVAALGGSLSIDSKPGDGTEVSATLPT